MAFDYGWCVPVLFLLVAIITIAAIIYSWIRRSGALPRTSNEMRNFIGGEEDTYLFCPDYGILAKQVGPEYHQTRGFCNVDWAPIGDISGKKYHLPTPLPTWCFDIAPIKLNPACGLRKIKIILPYERDTQLLFLKPYQQQIHELVMENSELKYMQTEIKRILYATQFTQPALEMIDDLERRKRPIRGASTVFKEQQPQLPEAKPPQQQNPNQGQPPQNG